MALMLSVLVGQGGRRALPLCWRVVRAPKGHFAQGRHRELLAQARALVPAGREVILLGDGEFDGPELLAAVRAAGWHFVCRTARGVRLAEADRPEETFRLGDLVDGGLLRPGQAVEMPEVLLTARGLGPLLVGAVWERGQREPPLLVTDLGFLHEARAWYGRRLAVETLFPDQKGRGFCLGHSHLADPGRLARLLIATCLAYYRMVYLGAEVVRRGWQGVVHRRHRCDLSLFQLGLLWLEPCLNENHPVPVYLRVEARCVR